MIGASCLGLLLGGALIGAAFAPGPARSLAAAAGQVVVVTAPLGPAGGSGAGDGPTATFAPSEPPVPARAAPTEPAAPAPVAPAPVLEPEPEQPIPVDDPAPEEPEPERPSIGHVFVVVLPGGPGAEAALTPEAPPGYFRDELVPLGQLMTGYEPVGTSSLSNRIAMVSGREPDPNTEADCPDYDACLVAPEHKTLADQLSTWGLEWRVYVDGMEEPCRRPDPADPFVYFHSVVDLATCSQYVLPLEPPDAKAVFTYTALSAPEQLESWVKPVLDSKPYKKDGLMVIVFDHAPDALVLSPFVEAGSTNDRAYNHYSLLKTIEDRIGLGEHLGMAAKKKVHAFGKDVFDTELDPLQEPEAP